jgi:hypothetical protein
MNRNGNGERAELSLLRSLRFVDHLTRELAAGSINIITPRFPYGDNQPSLLQNVAETMNRIVARARIGCVWEGVPRDQIEFAFDALDQLH